MQKWVYTLFDPYDYHFLIHMIIMWIYLMSCVHLACLMYETDRWQVGWPSCMAKKFNIGHYTQALQPVFFFYIYIPALYYSFFLAPFYTSLTLTLVGDHVVSAKQTSWLHFLTDLLQLIRMKFKVLLKQLKLNFEWDLMKWGKSLLFYWLRKKDVTLACIKTFMNWFDSLGMIIETIVLYILIPL